MERRIHLLVDLDIDKSADPARVADAFEAFLKADDLRERLVDLDIVSVDSVWLGP